MGCQNRTKHVYYIRNGRRVVAQITQPEGVIPGEIRYLHDDHLGSSHVVTDESGSVVEERSYDAFGRPRSATDWDDPNPDSTGSSITLGFTGHERDATIGLVNMGGRHYDPELGMFIEADPLVQAPLFSQSLNRYAYAWNNPLKLIDPTGFSSSSSEGSSSQSSQSDEPTVVATKGNVTYISNITIVGSTRNTSHPRQSSKKSQNQNKRGSDSVGPDADRSVNGGTKQNAPGGEKTPEAAVPRVEVPPMTIYGTPPEEGAGRNRQPSSPRGSSSGRGTCSNYAGIGCAPKAIGEGPRILAEAAPQVDQSGDMWEEGMVWAATWWLPVPKLGGLAKFGKLIRRSLRAAFGLADDAARGIGLGVKNTATALRSASEAYKGTTRLGHALSKHAGRNPNIWGKVTGNQTTWHGQALQHFRDILRGPGSFQRVTNSKGTTFLEKMLPDGRGVRLQLDYRFKGFID